MTREAFDHVDLWVFDLDNTLYPRIPEMWDRIDKRMTGYVSELLGLPWDEARAVQKKYLHQYGLTAKGLEVEHGADADAFMHYAHDIDLAILPENRPLAEAIRALPGRKVIHTNNTAHHAERTLEQIGLTGIFTEIHDIAAVGYTPKPARESFEAVMRRENAAATKAAMFEDAARNLAAPHEMGMVTVLVPTDCDWASDGAGGDHVHHVAEDLTAFLQRLT